MVVVIVKVLAITAIWYFFFSSPVINFQDASVIAQHIIK